MNNSNFFNEPDLSGRGHMDLKKDAESCAIGDGFPCSLGPKMAGEVTEFIWEAPSKEVKSRFKKIEIDVYSKGKRCVECVWERIE